LTDNTTLVGEAYESFHQPTTACSKSVLRPLTDASAMFNKSLSTTASFSYSSGANILTSTPAYHARRMHSKLTADETEVELLLQTDDTNKENEPPYMKERRRKWRTSYSPFFYRPARYRVPKRYSSLIILIDDGNNSLGLVIRFGIA
jgi:hypothetical protein